ncbi:hypothetical protein [Halomicronema hongdechloris]|uniref:hypothetical protein n=1 Tax=Halomicronema hongdechloris TaxID=1209493 RepID=UPI001650EC3B|nr:hypothetical protein [Halomicronema hongdechloris]
MHTIRNLNQVRQAAQHPMTLIQVQRLEMRDRSSSRVMMGSTDRLNVLWHLPV